MDSKDPQTLSRRRFLQLSSVAAGAAAIVPGGFVRAAAVPSPGTGPRQKILVLGAGLAGLAAAWELEEKGHDITVLEARTRPGGRVVTLREPFADGLYAEAGAVAYSAAYTEANRYIDALGLERADWAMPPLRQLHHLNGKRFSVGAEEAGEWPYELTDEERELGPVGLAQKYVGDHLPAEIANPETWSRPPLADLDRESLGEFMRRHGASEGAVALVQATQYYAPFPDATSMLSVAVCDFGLFMGGAPFLLTGGNDRLPRAMADRLTRSIRYGIRVAAIRQSESGVVIDAYRGDHRQSFEADRAICTVPATVLRGLDLEPGLSHEQRQAVQGVPYIDATRTYLQVDRGFWFDEGVTGAAPTDLPVGYVWSQPLTDPGGPEKRAILESYVSGPEAARLGGLTDEEVIEHTLRHMEKVHPTIRNHFEGGRVKAWSRDPYALGHISWPGPGDVTRYLAALQKPHGRVHFAGEHTSILRSSMEGALRSGIRAAREVDSASS